MKAFCYIIVLFLSVIFTQKGMAQPPERRTLPRQQQAESKDSDLPPLTIRAESKNQEQIQHVNNAPWLREVYRWIDLTKNDNAALYYPVQPIGDRMNLFTLLFKLMSQDKIKGYKYLEGREVFTDKNINPFEDILKQLELTYTTRRNGAKTEYVIEDSDIPSNEITLYLVKEAYFFDKANGTFNSTVLAICPTIVRQEDEFSEPIKTPLVWLNYDEIRPYLAQHLIMTSNLNNALTYTMDDYFRKGMYKGEIIKTTNMMNKGLAQLVGNKPEALKHAQDSIENQLKIFEKNLWVQRDTTKVSNQKKDKKESTKSTRGSSSSKQENNTPKTKTEKPATPTKSVRRTR